jgi:hypothetical protein
LKAKILTGLIYIWKSLNTSLHWTDNYPPKNEGMLQHMNDINPSIVVGRDRSHVRTLLSQYPDAEVVSAAAFFDKVRFLAFVENKKLRRDDHAPMIIAQKILLEQNSSFSVQLSNRFSSLYSSLYHGTSTPTDVLNHLGQEQYDFRSALEIVGKIDLMMSKHSLANGVSALYYSWQIMKNKNQLPLSFYLGQKIVLYYLVDLTLLEIEIIKELSHLGVIFDIYFPLDFNSRGINVSVDFSAQQFERCSELYNINLIFNNIAQSGAVNILVESLFQNESIEMSKKNCTIDVLADLIQEANHLAQMIAQILTEFPDSFIALAVPSIDKRSEIYKRTLLRYGISVRDRKGIPLLETQAGTILETLFSARLWSLPKNDLIGLINHPNFSLHVDDNVIRSRVLRLVSDLGIDDQILLEPKELRYQDTILKFRKILANEDERNQDLEFLSNWLEKTNNLLQLLPLHENFQGHLNAVLSLINNAFIGQDDSITILKETLVSFINSEVLQPSDPFMSLREFFLLLKSKLASITVPRSDNQDLNAVELLLLPELLGRKFDHVFIADISFGRMPKNSTPDPLIDDQARLKLNSLMKKTLLRVYFDDPFEPLPVPPRQALEPFWFASAVACAKKSVHFSCADKDENGQEQTPSEFMIWLLEHVRLDKLEAFSSDFKFLSPEAIRFQQGNYDRLTGSINELKEILYARKRAFKENQVSKFAFLLEPAEVLASFKQRLDKRPLRAITPTMVEAFSQCRFKGFAKQILKLRKVEKKDDGIDLLSLGQIAHRILELFFDEKIFPMINNKNRRLEKVLSRARQEFLQQNFVANMAVFSCHLEWLYNAISSLIEALSNKNLALLGDKSQELAFGIDKSPWPPLLIEANNRSYLLGGRVDRVDRINDHFLVTDYKLSSSSTLKAALTPKQMLNTSFQAAIYLRLVAYFLANDPSKVSFSFASIRDGEVLKALSEENHEIFLRIFDDQREDGLAQAIDAIFSPIRKGEVAASPGEQCNNCNFTFFCRKSEGMNDG